MSHSLSPAGMHRHHDGGGASGAGSKEDYNGPLAMREVPDHMSGAQAACWEGQSSKQSNSGSEVSLACLQGRIQAMVHLS